MRSSFVATLAAAGVLASAAAAVAQAPAAVVEDVSGDLRGVAFMDYVAAGQVIELGPGNALVLGYLRSCWRETIHGGTVTVGAEQSDVQAGQVERVKVECDGGKMQLTDGSASKSAGLVFRDRPKPGQQAARQPQVTLYGLSPVVEVKNGRILVIERLDQPGQRVQVTIAGRELLHGSFYDFAKSGTALAPGGLYRASLGAQSIVFRLDPSARPGDTPIIGRLLRFPPAG